MWFGIICINFAVRMKDFNIFHYFFAKNVWNYLFPQCKTSINYNSGSVKDRAIKYVYSRGVSEIVDRLV